MVKAYYIDRLKSDYVLWRIQIYYGLEKVDVCDDIAIKNQLCI